MIPNFLCHYSCNHNRDTCEVACNVLLHVSLNHLGFRMNAGSLGKCNDLMHAVYAQPSVCVTGLRMRRRLHMHIHICVPCAGICGAPG